jgi:hypothetical protein
VIGIFTVFRDGIDTLEQADGFFECFTVLVNFCELFKESFSELDMEVLRDRGSVNWFKIHHKIYKL